MKKNLFFFLLIFTVYQIKANPVPSPTIIMNKLFFDSLGNWTIELYYHDFDYPVNLNFDSICITSSSGISKIKNINKPDGAGFIVLTKDSLVSNLKINRNGDYVTVAKNKQKEGYSFFRFGNYKNSEVPSPRNGQSIVNVPIGATVLSKYQRLSVVGDTSGVFGTLKGKLYYGNNKLLTNSQNLVFYVSEAWALEYCQLKLNADGSYILPAYSGYEIFNSILYYNGTNTYYCYLDSIINLTMQPDSVIELDLHMKDTIIYNGINSLTKSYDKLIKIYPNPIGNDFILNYEISLPILCTQTFLNLYSLNGQKIKGYKIVSNKNSITLPTNLKNDSYILQLMVNNKSIFSQKILIQK